MGRNHRARWAAIGAAVAVSIGAGGIITLANAAGGTASTFTPITPCRLLDTRPAPAATGATPPRQVPIGQGETITVPARGDFGKCVGLSATATGAVLNITVVEGTTGSFLTVWPADSNKPLASSLNWVAGQAATPNQVTTALDPSGQFSLFNNAGTVQVIVDVVGLYEPAASGGGAEGLTGPSGPQGPTGNTGPQGLTGLTGSNGATWRTGAGVPDNASGVDGDLYVNTNNADVYKRAAGSYSVITNIKGATGSAGGVGPEGPPGTGANVMTASAPDPLGLNGSHSSLVLDNAGDPVVSHYDEALGHLLLTHCNDPACAPPGDVTNVVDSSAAGVGQFTSLRLDASGFPVISYYDSVNRHLKLAHCNDVSCAGADDSVVTVDTAAETGQYSSLALDPSGFPVISYYDAGPIADNLKVAHCTADADCVGAKTITSAVTSGITGLFTSIEMYAGLPTIAFYDLSTEQIRVRRCANLNCTGSPIANPVVTTPLVAEQNLSLALDASGFPVISFFDPGFELVSVAHCSDLTCSAAPAEGQLMDPIGGLAAPVHSSIVLDSSGFPVVSYYDTGSFSLRVGHCLDATCATSVVSIADLSNGAYSSIALDSNGFPIISSYDEYNYDLVITRCVDPYCNPRRIRSISG